MPETYPTESAMAATSKEARRMFGASLHSWENSMVVFLIIAGGFALLAGVATWAVVRLQRLEVAAANRELEQYKLEAGAKISEAEATGKAAQAEIEKARVEIANANAKAAEASQKAEEERLARIKIEARIAPRTLPQEQQEELTDILKGYTVKRTTLAASPSTPEAEMFARALGAPLKQAGWNVEILPGTPTATVLFPTGIVINASIPLGSLFFPDKDPPSDAPTVIAAVALSKYLNALGIASTVVPNPAGASGELAIIISSK